MEAGGGGFDWVDLVSGAGRGVGGGNPIVWKAKSEGMKNRWGICKWPFDRGCGEIRTEEGEEEEGWDESLFPSTLLHPDKLNVQPGLTHPALVTEALSSPGFVKT